MRLNQVTVASTDVERAVAFYRRLGLRLIVRSYPRYARLACPDGDASFSIHHDPEVAGRSGTLVYFECDDLDGRCAELRAAGVRFDSEPTDESWLWREARLRDPDGNPVCLYHAGLNRLDPPWRVRDEP